MFVLHLLAWFLSGAFLTNAVPHFVAGVQGRSFQSPFARPRGVGVSSPRSNVAWGFINLAAGWALLTQVGSFEVAKIADAAALGAGMLATGLGLGGYFGRFYAEGNRAAGE